MKFALFYDLQSNSQPYKHVIVTVHNKLVSCYWFGWEVCIQGNVYWLLNWGDHFYVLLHTKIYSSSFLWVAR